MEGGLSYLGQSQAEALHQQLHKHTRQLVAPENVHGVSERLGGGCYQGNIHLPPGAQLIPLNETQVEKGVNALLDSEIEVIGILFLYSFVDPVHEHQAKAICERIIAERGSNVPVVCSADVAPVSKENGRLKSLHGIPETVRNHDLRPNWRTDWRSIYCRQLGSRQRRHG
jgi:N-methylhydantoinase A